MPHTQTGLNDYWSLHTTPNQSQKLLKTDPMHINI